MEQDTKQDIITNTMTDKTKKNNRGLIVGMSICAILAIGGIGFGTYGMIQSTQKDNQISDLKVQVEDSRDKIASLETTKSEAISKCETTTVTDSPTLVTEELEHYIYIAQWNVKIALPSSLSSPSYRYSTMPGHTTLDIAGVDCSAQGQCQYAPEFADLFKTNFSLGAISRFRREDPQAAASGEKVISIGDYDYYYVHPQAVYSTDPSEVTWETNSVKLIKETLTNPDNYSSIQ
ncbi:hypothetical protein IKE72_00530 [Candidatus Saccharibacteria bacterium]|nr:hypothetical protein [Candidatus Saccharibacteria bacterium]